MHRQTGTERSGLTTRRGALILSGVFIGVLASGLARTVPARVVQAPAAPQYVYRQGSQGPGYYVSRAPRQGATSNRPRTVGPGTRNWATGNRVGLHRPWMRAR